MRIPASFLNFFVPRIAWLVKLFLTALKSIPRPGLSRWFLCLAYWQFVRGWQGAPAPVAWGWDPGPLMFVRGWQYAANSIICVRSYSADPERPNVVSSDGLAL